MNIRHHPAWTALGLDSHTLNFIHGGTKKRFRLRKNWLASFKLLSEANQLPQKNNSALLPMRHYFSMLLPCIAIASNAYGAEPAPTPQPNTLYFCKESGQDVYTNTKLNNKCKGVVLSHGRPPIQTPSPASKAPSAQTPSTFPRVSETAQKTRDADRKHILEQEMAVEEKSLERAKKDLSQQESKVPAEERSRKEFAERIQPFKEKVAQHERNIQALRKEMGNIK